MGEWKARRYESDRLPETNCLNLPFENNVRLGMWGQLFSKWRLKQLKTVGSTEQLLKFEIRSLIDGSKLPRDT
jgi:hypothetical protein